MRQVPRDGWTTGGAQSLRWAAYSSVPVPRDGDEDDERDEQGERGERGGGSRDRGVSRPELGFRETFRAADVTVLTNVDRRASSSDVVSKLRANNNGCLGFGQFYSDHMLTVAYDGSKGWSRPVIGGLEAIRMHPAAQVLHYGMSCFEGMKVYRDLSTTGNEDPPRLLFFRPELNLARFVNSARRLHLPSSFCTSELLELLRILVRKDDVWVPGRRGEALYLRPVLYSATEMLGVAPPDVATLNVIMSPSGDYFGKSGNESRNSNGSRRNQAIRLFVEEAYTRAWLGGAGDAKVGGNYAPTIYPQWLAKQRYGVDQVVYTRGDGPNKEIEECGAMNIFFVFDGEDGQRELVTPSLGHGTILPGVTRASILEIGRVWADRGEALTVSERGVGVEELVDMARRGKLREVFACGTASVIQPVGGMVRRIDGCDGTDEPMEITPRDALFGEGSLARRLYDTLCSIQHGLCDDPCFSRWTVEV